MILAGEIGATHTRLAAFEKEGSRLQLVVEKTYMSQKHSSLSEIIAAFIKAEGIAVHRACFGVAGPVRRGRSKISNLPWVIDSRDLAKQLQLDSVGMINDLEAYAYGIDGLDSKDFVTLNEGSEDAEGNRAVISARTGLRRRVRPTGESLRWNEPLPLGLIRTGCLRRSISSAACNSAALVRQQHRASQCSAAAPSGPAHYRRRAASRRRCRQVAERSHGDCGGRPRWQNTRGVSKRRGAGNLDRQLRSGRR